MHMLRFLRHSQEMLYIERKWEKMRGKRKKWRGIDKLGREKMSLCLHFPPLSTFPLSISISPLSPFPHSPSIPSTFPHSLPVSSKSGCRLGTPAPTQPNPTQEICRVGLLFWNPLNIVTRVLYFYFSCHPSGSIFFKRQCKIFAFHAKV